MLTKTQIDKLGERLKAGPTTDDDIQLLETFRRSFMDAYAFVAIKIHDSLGVTPTARPLKSTRSIIDKLRRERTRLSTMQDIAGCRFTVSDIRAQDDLAAKLAELLGNSGVNVRSIDRRQNPSHGYRAIHMVAGLHDRYVEIQIRTELQHQWAEMCESLADRFGNELKYGGGAESIQYMLETTSLAILDIEFPPPDPAGLAESSARFGDALVEAMKQVIREVKERKEK